MLLASTLRRLSISDAGAAGGLLGGGRPPAILTQVHAMRYAIVVICLSAAAASSACSGEGERTSSVGPSSTGVAALLGNWTSANLVPSADACTDFKWNVTQQSGNTASGSLSATCKNLQVAGTASGTLSGSTITWNAQATATVPGLPACAISLTGTAELGVDSIRVPYSGDTCIGRVSGVEVLRKN
jgi:hypothetical protein